MKLFKLGNGNWKLSEEGFNIEGSWAFIYSHMLYELEIDLEEINFALDELEAKGHDTAHFGLALTVTHTSSSSLARQIAIQLEAIQAVKEEVVRAFYKDKHGTDYRNARKRLEILAMTLDVDTALKVINGDTLKLAA